MPAKAAQERLDDASLAMELASEGNLGGGWLRACGSASINNLFACDGRAGGHYEMDCQVSVNQGSSFVLFYN
jgi:uncharacterized membrane protein